MQNWKKNLDKMLFCKTIEALGKSIWIKIKHILQIISAQKNTKFNKAQIIQKQETVAHAPLKYMNTCFSFNLFVHFIFLFCLCALKYEDNSFVGILIECGNDLADSDISTNLQTKKSTKFIVMPCGKMFFIIIARL